MTRREIREHIFKILFRAEFFDREEFKEQLSLCFQEIGDIGHNDAEYLTRKTDDICLHLDEIDTLINEHVEKWKTSRMAKAELAIIRLAVYEMKYEEEIPVSVAINEAVELAKIYGSDNGAAFVNGVLAKLA